MQQYRVAILGCRGRGTAAGRAYHQHPRTEVVALCDLVPERLAELGDELGIAARYDDLDRMIEAEAPDIVAIPTGTEFHYPLAMRVLEHGVHIDIEKPICTTLAEADAVLAKAAEQGVQVAVHHQGRSGGALQAVKAAIAEGRIGELRYVQGSGKGYYGGYGLMNIATHSLNAMLGVVGPVRSVQAVALTDGRPITPEDVVPSPSGMGYIAGEHVTAALAFECGISGTLLQHRFPKVDSTAYMIEIYGTEGRLYWKSGAPWFLSTPHFAPGQSEWQPLDPIVPEHYDPEGPAAVEDYQFADEYVQALDEGRAHECSGEAGRHVLEILMGIFESGARGQRVDLPQAEREHPLLRWREEHGMGLPSPMPRPYAEWLAAEDRRLGRRTSLYDEHLRISRMMFSLTMSWPIECMDQSVLCNIESWAQNGDMFLEECRGEIHRHLKTITDPENYDSIAQAFTMYSEANTYLLLKNKGIQLNRTPGTGGHQQKRPDFLFSHSSGEVYFEVKCPDFKGGKDRHRDLSYKALDVAVDLDQRARNPGVHFGEEMVIAPFGEGSTPADRIEILISKLENNIKVEQLRYGPCILVVDLGIMGPITHHPSCILPIYYDENLKSCASGELWHVALGYSGDMIYKLPEFDGQPNLDRCLKKDGIIRQYPELLGISFVLHRLSGKKEIFSIQNMTPKKSKLKKQCMLSEREIIDLIYSYSDAFNNSGNEEQFNYVHQTL